MSEPIVTMERVSDKPVKWRAGFKAFGMVPDGAYELEIVGYGKTPSAAQASAYTNLERVKARMLVASIELNRVPEIAEGAGK